MMMASQAAADSPPGHSCSLDLPSASDIHNYLLRSASPSSAGSCSASEPAGSSLNTEQKDSWTCDDLWLGASENSQSKANEEDGGLRYSLDRFYEVFGRPQPLSKDSLSAPVCQCLSQKIAELRDQGGQKYALCTFQMARVIFSRDGCSVLQRHGQASRFYPLHEGNESLDDEKQTPGLSKDVIRFLLQQNLMKDL